MSPTAPRPLAPPPPTGDARLDALARLLAIVDRLRAPDGCPWDNEQSLPSLAPSLVEEAHEAVEAIDRADERGTVEELGDLLLVIALGAKIASQEGRFDMAAIADAVADKLVRRHPHVFGDVRLDSSAQALANWEKIKAAERRDGQEDPSALAGVPVALPALQRADRVAAKSIASGFRWADEHGAFVKLAEELRELEHELGRSERDQERVAEELGDVLLAGAFLGRYLGIDPEKAARDSLRRFEQRFRRMEAALGERFRGAPLSERMAAWETAKRESAAGPGR
jgi:MazG family protein